MGVTAHWIDAEWVLHDKIIYFRHVLESHTGENLASRFQEVIMPNSTIITLMSNFKKPFFIVHIVAVFLGFF